MELPPAGRKWIGYLLFEILNNRSLQSNFLFENNWKQGWNEIYEVLTDKQSSLSLCILFSAIDLFSGNRFNHIDLTPVFTVQWRLKKHTKSLLYIYYHKLNSSKIK